MTSHELAKKLLEMEDLPVIVFDNDYDSNQVTAEYVTKVKRKRVSWDINVWSSIDGDTDVIEIF